LAGFLQDVRYAFRMLARTPGLTLVAVLTLGLGIGANTAIFSVVNAVLLQPLRYPEPNRIVQLMLSDPGGNRPILSIPEFVSFRQQISILQDVSAYDFGGPGVNLTSGDRPEQVKGIRVSADYFRLFGAPVVAGRTFNSEEDRPGGGHFVILSEGLWRHRFGGSPNVIGQTLSLCNEPYTVVGVLGSAFDPDPPADLWLPLQADLNRSDYAHFLRVAGRLKPGVGLDRANVELTVAVADFRRKFPLFNPKVGFTAELMRDSLVSDVRQALLVLLGAVSFVLLIACANVASLLLIRATARRREIAIRGALGAGPGRIVRQLLTESVLLSIAAGALGLGLGDLGVRGLLALSPGSLPRVGEQGAAIAMDGRILAFALGLSVLTGIIFGVIPALQAFRTGLSEAIKESASRSASGFRQNKARSILVITELALALVLLTGAALLMRSFVALRAVDPGFDPHNILTMEMSLTGERFEKTSSVAQLVREAQRRLESLPGVVAVASSEMLPLESTFGSSFIIEGRPLTDSPVHGGAGMRPVSARYFEVFRIPLLRGRMFTERDDSAASGAVIINQAMAKKYWPTGDPIGERLSVDKYTGPEFEAPPRQIIGIVGDVRDWGGLNQDPTPMLYLHQPQVTDGMTALDNTLLPLTWVIRTSVEPYSLSAAIQEELRKASSGLAVARVRSMNRVVSQSTARSDFNTALFTIFAAIALGLAAVGIFGLMAYSVQQRTREIGIRLAVGASPGQVRGMVLYQSMALIVGGILFGLVGALGLTRLMVSLAYGVKPSDPFVLAGAAISLGLVALLATSIPALRATRIDPAKTLKCE